MIHYHCSQCGHQFELPDENTGKMVTCEQCHTAILVPGTLFSHTDTSEIPDGFLQEDFEIWQSLLQHEREAPPVEVPK